MEIRELQNIEYALLTDFADLMDRNGIQHWIAYGTCLGAARHQGFIPWDDDVDVYISGEDYPKLYDIFATQDTGVMELHDFKTKDNYPFIFPKVVNKKIRLKENRYAEVDYNCGVFIDIFPLFELSSVRFIRQLQYAKCKFYRGIVEAGSREIVGGRTALTKIFKLFNPGKAQENLFKIYTRKQRNSEYLSEPLQYGDDTKWAKLHKRKNFSGSDELPFEGTMFHGSKNHTSYLIEQYGDWQTPPPLDKRTTSHGFAYIEVIE